MRIMYRIYIHTKKIDFVDTDISLPKIKVTYHHLRSINIALRRFTLLSFHILEWVNNHKWNLFGVS